MDFKHIDDFDKHKHSSDKETVFLENQKDFIVFLNRAVKPEILNTAYYQKKWKILQENILKDKPFKLPEKDILPYRSNSYTTNVQFDKLIKGKQSLSPINKQLIVKNALTQQRDSENHGKRKSGKTI